MGREDEYVVEELMTLSSLVSEGLVTVEKPAASSSSSQPHNFPPKAKEVKIKPDVSSMSKPSAAKDNADGEENAVAVEMVTSEPAVYFVDLVEQDDDIVIEDDAFDPPSTAGRKRSLPAQEQESQAKRAKLLEAKIEQQNQIDAIRRAQEERWKSQKKPGSVDARKIPAKEPQYQPQFYNKLSGIRDQHRQKWRQAAGGLKRVWTMRDIEEKERQEQKDRIDHAGGPVPTATSSSDPIAVGMKSLELTNEFRKSQKLPPLKWNQALYNIGLTHSKDMGDGKVPFSHDGFNKRMAAVPYRVRSFAENVAWNAGFSNPAKTAVDGWIQSPGHRKNMVGNFEYCGIAVYRNAKGAWYFTQLFSSS